MLIPQLADLPRSIVNPVAVAVADQLFLLAAVGLPVVVDLVVSVPDPADPAYLAFVLDPDLYLDPDLFT